MYSKKAMELSMNTIIVAVIALIVLVVVALIFTGRFSIFTRGLDDCEQVGGKCRLSCGSGWIKHPSAACEDTIDDCCIPYDPSLDDNPYVPS